MRIYTRGGDQGETGLSGRRRVSKADPVIEAVGQLDELNAWLGLVVSTSQELDLSQILVEIQRDLFELGAELASENPASRLSPERISFLEQHIDRLSLALPPLRHFILPGGDRTGALCHVARTVARRAERAVVALGRCNPSDAGAAESLIVAYLNRLSDLLFVMARTFNHRAGRPEPLWQRDEPHVPLRRDDD